ncbi:3-hydroxyacyl-CoA dehydrogenase family protein [Streptomyces ureilyticus]|uniref:3-hydroxyacyl-CoA dehydrogenase family protein n=1 Tax=Streptomyces ureilyticus TaxID=1775131 RepID=A0ABX0DW59_9ACTN|nr:3-hydroxyacyl-CoA dehydrogenase family protein [Streptomyces ureilyticus]NGO45858.1 3-hydroxyacyl-CoA dehydrogenase family protein [Streptomyces ureilyticus]
MQPETAPPPPPLTVGVVGAGTMGVGVAQCLAAAGHDVIVVDPDPGALADGPARLREGARAAVLLRKAPRDAPDLLPARVRWTDELRQLGDVSFVVECAPERIPLKEELFRDLAAVCPPGAVLASCTSAIPVDRLAAHTGRPEQVLGMHVMNPAWAKDAVEVVRGPRTGAHTLDRALGLLAGMGKHGIVVSDGPGFVSNRVLMATVNDAAAVVQAGTADAATVDRVFQECFGHAMGPLGTADLIGLDTVVDTLDVLRTLTADARFTPCALLAGLVAEGRLGRKTGQGFHTYPGARRHSGTPGAVSSRTR